jgi:hypothetical protein
LSEGVEEYGGFEIPRPHFQHDKAQKVQLISCRPGYFKKTVCLGRRRFSSRAAEKKQNKNAGLQRQYTYFLYSKISPG